MKWTIIVFSVFCCMACVGQEENTIFGADRAGLVGAWLAPGTISPKLYEVANNSTWLFDASGYNNHGVATNWPSGKTKNLGIMAGGGHYVSFDSSWGNNVPCGNNPAVDITKGGLSVVVWVNRADINVNRCPVGKVTSGSHQFDVLLLSSGAWRFLVGNGGAYKSYAGGQVAGSTWVMLCGTWDQKTGAVRLFRDATEESTTSDGSFTTTGNLGNGGNLIIGCRGDPGFYMNGSIGLVMLFNRAISHQEIRRIYAETKGLYK